MSLIERIKQFVAWVGGAVAGLSVLFYAAGYLAYRTHTNMLGLTSVVDYQHEQLLYEGAKFFLTVGAYLLQMFFVIGLVLLIALVIVMLLRQVGGIERRWQGATTWLRGARERTNKKYPGLPGTVALVLFAAAFIWHTERFFYPLQDLYTDIEFLLYQTPPEKPPASCVRLGGDENGAKTVAAWLLLGEQCRAWLLAEFRQLLAAYVLLLFALGYVALAPHAAERSLLYRIATGTLAAYAVLYTVMLPMAFGVLVRSPIYPVITVKTATGGGSARSELLLLNKNERGILVWDRAARSAAWLPVDAATEIYVQGQANLFSRPPKGGTKP